jgi:hypothetical protein
MGAKKMFFEIIKDLIGFGLILSSGAVWEKAEREGRDDLVNVGAILLVAVLGFCLIRFEG